MPKQKSSAQIHVAGGAGSMRQVADLRFETCEWPIELVVKRPTYSFKSKPLRVWDSVSGMTINLLEPVALLEEMEGSAVRLTG